MTPPVTEIEQVRREVIKHGESISSIVTDANRTKEELSTLRAGIESDRKVRQIEDKHLNERLDDIEESIKTLNTLGRWILATFSGAFIVALVSFVVKGGLTIVP